ncbi:MAG: hypothetical protein L6437_00690, partial [Kiritimatiellae bacterium]|nr:hypothetical protein [Kiritimatiellia bacterium]
MTFRGEPFGDLSCLNAYTRHSFALTAAPLKQNSLTDMEEGRLRAIFAEAGHDFSGEVCPGLALADLDVSAIEDFR